MLLRMSRLRCLCLCLLLLAGMRFGLAQTETQKPGAADKDLQALQDYRLSMDKVNNWYSAMDDLTKTAQSNPGMEKEFAGSSEMASSESLAEQERHIGAFPPIAAVLARHGMTPHEFLMTEYTLLQASLAAGVRKAGADPKKLIEDAKVNPANLDFVEQHQAELEALQKKMAEASKKSQGDTDEQ